MIYKMTLKDSADEMTFDLLEVPIVDKDIEGAVDNVTLDGNQYTDYLWLKKQFIQKWSILCDDEYTRLRGFYTRQFENADVPSYRLYYGDDIIRNSTLSGERIELSISGVADGTMSLTQMDGDIEQDGTPTPSAPVPVQTVTGRQTIKAMGKNLIEPIMPSWTYNGVLCTNNGDGSFTLNGTATATSTWRISQSTANGHDNMLNLNGTYTLSCSGLQNGMRLVVTQLNVWQTVGAMNGNENPATFTTNLNDLIVYVAVTNGTTVNNVTIRPMLEVGNRATAYEPYKAQEYEINLGKNLLKLPTAPYTAQGLTTTPNADGSLTYTGTATGQWANMINTYSNPMPAGTYMFSKQTGHYYTLRFDHADGTNTRISISTTQSGEITLPKDATGYQFWVWGLTPNTEYNVTERLQLERGYRATDFAPYFDPIELCKIGTWQDRIYKENGKWYLHKEIGRYDITGTENWTRSGRTTSTVFAGVLANDALTEHMQIGANECFSNRFIYKGATIEAGGYDVYNYSSGVVKAFALYISIDSASDITAFKSWLTNNPTTFYYVLATPTTTEITNEALVAELEALQDEAISVGQHNIYTDTPNALPTLTFDLTEYLSQSTTIIPETAVRLTLTDGGVINACGCRKDVQLTMRETIE